MNTNDVETDPSPETLISSGFKTTSENGKTLWVGTPNSTVLICKVTGISVSSFVLKYISHLVKKIPVFSTTENVCAKGSLPLYGRFVPNSLLNREVNPNLWDIAAPVICSPVNPVSEIAWPSAWTPKLSLNGFESWMVGFEAPINCLKSGATWLNVCVAILAFLTDRISSWIVSISPWDVNPSSDIVTDVLTLFKELSVSLKDFNPVSNLGKADIFGFGI